MDLSQAVQRRPWFAGRIRAVTKSSLVYSFDEDAVISPRGYALVQGLPASIPESIRPDHLKGLAGEAMFLGNLAAVVWAVYVDRDAPWQYNHTAVARGAAQMGQPSKRARGF